MTCCHPCLNGNNLFLLFYYWGKTLDIYIMSLIPARHLLLVKARTLAASVRFPCFLAFLATLLKGIKPS